MTNPTQSANAKQTSTSKPLYGKAPECDCEKCDMVYCDCSEEETGTVPASHEYWEAPAKG